MHYSSSVVRTLSIMTLGIALAMPSQLAAQAPVATAGTEPTHVVVWREPGRYGGWPANHGIWSWGDEILVGFSAGHMKTGDVGPGGPARHPIDRSRPEQHLVARSRDGGASWTIERNSGLIPPPRQNMAGVPTEEGGRAERPYPGAADMTNPDFVMTFRMGDINKGPSWFFTSTDRGHTWEGPWTFPRLDLPGIAARTDYLVTGKQTALAFMTAAKSNGREGRPFVAETKDGGRTFSFVSWIGPEPAEGFVIMPSTVRLDDGTLVTATRRQVPAGNGIDIYRSADAGRSWTFVTTAVSDTGRGNPPSLVKLADGRLVVTYGYRAQPYSIRARLSRDGGRTWETERILRADASDWDLGYTRSVQRRDGKIVTVYYYNDPTAAERYIGATIWDPGR